MLCVTLNPVAYTQKPFSVWTIFGIRKYNKIHNLFFCTRLYVQIIQVLKSLTTYAPCRVCAYNVVLVYTRVDHTIFGENIIKMSQKTCDKKKNLIFVFEILPACSFKIRHDSWAHETELFSKKVLHMIFVCLFL